MELGGGGGDRASAGLELLQLTVRVTKSTSKGHIPVCIKVNLGASHDWL